MYLVESPEDVWTLNVKNEGKLSFMTQTTLSVDDTSDVIDALRKRFPKIVGPRKDDICYATTNRQEAVRALAEQADVVLVVGSKTLLTLTDWRNWPNGWEKPRFLSTMRRISVRRG